MSAALRFNLQMQHYESIKGALVEAQDERRLRDGINPETGEPGWVVYEREVVTDRVNLLRSRLGKAPVSMDYVRVKESLANGHIDYTAKYALGAAELVGMP